MLSRGNKALEGLKHASQQVYGTMQVAVIISKLVEHHVLNKDSPRITVLIVA